MGHRGIVRIGCAFFPGQEQVAGHCRITVRLGLGLIQRSGPVACRHVPVGADGPQGQRTAHQVFLQVHRSGHIAVTATDLGGHIGRRIVIGQLVRQGIRSGQAHFRSLDGNGPAQGQIGFGAVVAGHIGADVRLFLDQFVHIPDAGRIVVVCLAGDCGVIGADRPIRTGDAAAQLLDLLGTGADAAAGELGRPIIGSQG